MGNFCETRKEMQLSSRAQARILHVHWSRFGKDLELWKVHRQPIRKMGRTCKKSHGCISWTKTSNPERMQKLPKRGKNMHFNAGAASQEMRMELISSANDICMLYGIGVFLGLMKQDDLDFDCSYSKSLVPCQLFTSICCVRPLRKCLVRWEKRLSTSINCWR